MVCIQESGVKKLLMPVEDEECDVEEEGSDDEGGGNLAADEGPIHVFDGGNHLESILRRFDAVQHFPPLPTLTSLESALTVSAPVCGRFWEEGEAAVPQLAPGVPSACLYLGYACDERLVAAMKGLNILLLVWPFAIANRNMNGKCLLKQ